MRRGAASPSDFARQRQVAAEGLRCQMSAQALILRRPETASRSTAVMRGQRRPPRGGEPVALLPRDGHGDGDARPSRVRRCTRCGRASQLMSYLGLTANEFGSGEGRSRGPATGTDGVCGWRLRGPTTTRHVTHVAVARDLARAWGHAADPRRALRQGLTPHAVWVRRRQRCLAPSTHPPWEARAEPVLTSCKLEVRLNAGPAAASNREWDIDSKRSSRFSQGYARPRRPRPRRANRQCPHGSPAGVGIDPCQAARETLIRHGVLFDAASVVGAACLSLGPCQRCARIS